MLNAIFVDDEESNLSSLKEKISRHCPQVNILALCDSAQKGISAINSLQPDVVFLDIEMPLMNGFVLLQELSYKNFEVIFTTAYDHYAIKAIRYSALDYLVKPIEIDDLKTAVQKAEEKKQERTPNRRLELLLENLSHKKTYQQRIAIPTLDGLHFIKVDEIVYLEASVNYTNIYLSTSEKYLVCHTLKEFEEMLDSDIFLRIHHSHIINKNFAVKYIRGEGGQVILSNGIRLDVAKRKKAEFLKAIGH